MTNYLLDTGFLYATIDGTDDRHLAVKTVIENIRGKVILPVPVITETTYFLSRNLGLEAVAKFLDNLSISTFLVENPSPEDYVRSAEILRKYTDAKIDFVDVCLMAIAERLNITKILTIDRRHFSISVPNIATPSKYCHENYRTPTDDVDRGPARHDRFLYKNARIYLG